MITKKVELELKLWLEFKEIRSNFSMKLNEALQFPYINVMKFIFKFKAQLKQDGYKILKPRDSFVMVWCNWHSK